MAKECAAGRAVQKMRVLTRKCRTPGIAAQDSRHHNLEVLIPPGSRPFYIRISSFSRSAASALSVVQNFKTTKEPEANQQAVAFIKQVIPPGTRISATEGTKI